MMNKLFLMFAHEILLLLYSKKRKTFWKAIEDVEGTQQKLLDTLLKANVETSFGKQHGFREIQSIDEYRNRVPLLTYTDLKPYIDRICQGEEKVLTAEPVLMLEQSSGTTSASKLIPYTPTLKSEFIKGIAPWICDLYKKRKQLAGGKSYWSVTPVYFNRQKTPGGIPIGFEEDSQYFGFIEQFFLNRMFAVPKEVMYISHMESFRYVTMLFLLKQKTLAFISVWNPTFLTLLIQILEPLADNLAADLKSGSIHAPGDVPTELVASLSKKLGKNPKRAREIVEILDKHRTKRHVHRGSLYEDIWPHLRLISCWTDANAAMYIPQLKKYFPNVEIQGKGLIATEGFVSFPVIGKSGGILAVQSHFFEFIEYDELQGYTKDSLTYLAHEIKTGKTYSVILTTGGGFYRYRLLDLIQVTGFIKGCPLIRFVGKEGNISDYFGEKLNEFHVSNVLISIFSKYGINPSFYMLAPEIHLEEGSHYTLFLELHFGEDRDFPDKMKDMAKKIEKDLCENFHYKYCRDLGQLEKIRLFLIHKEQQAKKNAAQIYLEACEALGQRMGNIKPVALHTGTGWEQRFGMLSHITIE